MRTLVIAISAAALGLAGCVTSDAVGRCPPKAKVAAKAKPAAKAKAMVTEKPAADHAPALATLLAKAKAAHKPLLLQFSTSWCGACKLFDKTIAPAPPMAFLLEKTVYVVYDAEHGAGAAAADRFGVQGYPTFLLFDPSGHLVWHQVGIVPTPAAFADLLDAGLARALPAKTVTAMASGHPSPQGRLLIAAWDLRHAKAADARRQLAAAEQSDPKGTHDVAPRALRRRLALGVADGLVRAVAREYTTLIDRYPTSTAAESALVSLVLTEPAGSKTARAAARRLIHANAHDATRLNDLVYALIGGGLPRVALEAARAQVKLLPKDYNAEDSLGEALNAVGNHKAAAAAGTRAVALGRANHVNPHILAALTADQARYARGGPSPFVASYRRRRQWYRTAFDHVDPERLVAADQGMWRPRPQQRFEVTLSRVLLAAGRACRVHAGKLHHAWVVLRLKASGGRPISVRVDDPKAPATLETCLVRHLSKEKLPADPPMRFAGGEFVVARATPLDL